MGQTRWKARCGVVAGIVPVAAIVLAAAGSSAASNGVTAASTVDVKTGTTSLGTVLENSRSRTLYHLTAEKNGRFLCTGSCTQTWHPLRPKGKTPKGTSAVHSLGIIRRPDHTKQITYKGFPLYAFAGDSKPGDVKGQGFKDVGTWKAVVIKKPAPPMPTPTQTQTTPPSSGYGY